MSESTIDFMSPDWDYYIETSLIRDEIQFLARISGIGTFLLRLETLQSAEQMLAYYIDRNEDLIPLYGRRGLILVDELDRETLHWVVEQTQQQHFFPAMRSIEELSLSFDHLREYDYNLKQYIPAPPLSDGLMQEKQDFTQGDMVAVEEISVRSDYFGNPLEYVEVSLKVQKSLTCSLKILTPQAIASYFASQRSTLPEGRPAFLALPGIVVVPDIDLAKVPEIVKKCTKELYLMTLKPVM